MSKQLVIIDYGVGNFRSVQKAFQTVGADAVISDNPAEIIKAAGVVLPGVGAFGDAIANIRARQQEVPILEAARSGKPFFGICVGMQLLFEESSEMGHHKGLNLLSGQVRRFREGLTVPHMGWNQIEPTRPHPLLTDIDFGAFTYFAHSYHCQPAEQSHILAQTDYHGHYVTMIAHENICGIQFHPEKSQRVGLQILKNFTDIVSR